MTGREKCSPRFSTTFPDPIFPKVPRISGTRLQAIRKRWFDAHPLCVICEREDRVRVATELDHIKRLEDGGLDDDSNRQGLCHECHLAKTLKEKGYDMRETIGADGFPIERNRA